jgi:hypothetical protein
MDHFFVEQVLIRLLLALIINDGVAEEVDRQIIKDFAVAGINFFR